VVGLAGPEGLVDGAGLVRVGAGVVVVGRGVGKVGSVGPAPGVATGLPSTNVLQPETNAGLARTAESSSEPPASLRRAFSDNCTRRSPKVFDSSA
jgi:hypothetical protein